MHQCATKGPFNFLDATELVKDKLVHQKGFTLRPKDADEYVKDAMESL
jgi:hypothetical protein